MSSDIPERNHVLGLGLAVALVVSAAAGGLALGAVSQTEASTGDASAPTVDASALTEDASALQWHRPLVRFVHAIPERLPVNVTINDKQMYTNVSFGNVTDYVWVASGTHTVTVSLARSDDEIIIEETIDVQEGTQYTVAAGGELTAETQQAVVLEDEPNATGDQSQLRLTHLSPDAPAVDVVVNETGRVLFDNVTYQNSSAYVNLPAGNHTLEVRRATADGSGEVIATANVSLNASTSYSAFAIGYADPGRAVADTPFDIVVAAPTTTDPGPETSITPTPVGAPDETETPTETEGNETDE